MALDKNVKCERIKELRQSFAEVCDTKNWTVQGNQVLELVTPSGIRVHFSVQACSEESSGGCDVFIRLPDKKKVEQVDRFKNARGYYAALSRLPDEVRESIYGREGYEVFVIRVSGELMGNKNIAKMLFKDVERFVNNLLRVELTSYCEMGK